MPTETRWCAPCAQEQPFETPPCQDGHGPECPDLACVVCGHAVVLGVALPAAAVPVVLAAA